MTAEHFRARMRQHLISNADRVILRVALSSRVREPVEITGSALLKLSVEIAEKWSRAGESKVVLLLLPHSLELFLLHLGLVLQGRVPAILAWPTNRVDAQKYQRNLVHQLRSLPADELITLPGLAANLSKALPFLTSPCHVEGTERIEDSFKIPPDLTGLDQPMLPGNAAALPRDALFLQFSGGTTGAQKCVVVTAGMLVNQLQRLQEVLYATSNEDGVVSWLPMYHDMGLIACLWFPLWTGLPSLQFAASDWLLAPDLLFEFAERYRATLCWLPNFAFSYLASQRSRMRRDYSLAHMRALISCSEPVRLRSMTTFASTFADWGIAAEQLQASYAMAENVFAVTQTPLGTAPAVFSRAKVAHRAVPLDETAFSVSDSVYVSSGRALQGMQVRITGANSFEVPDHHPGNIELLTECLFCGYWGKDGYVTTALSSDGWYSTGDYGFKSGDDLFVIGRLKDIIIVGGQNIFPEDVEALVNGIDGVYPGRVVVFGVEDEQYGTEALAVIAELRGVHSEETASHTERRIRETVLVGAGIAPRYVKTVPERWIVKSTAGKISRKETREKFLEERARAAVQS